MPKEILVDQRKFVLYVMGVQKAQQRGSRIGRHGGGPWLTLFSSEGGGGLGGS